MKFEKFGGKICLNMNFKTDKEDRSCDDIAFLSEIITNSRYWQVIVTPTFTCIRLFNYYNVAVS